jgi:hypothetical protein
VTVKSSLVSSEICDAMHSSSGLKSTFLFSPFLLGSLFHHEDGGNTLLNFYHATRFHIPEDSALRGFYVMFQVIYVYIKRIKFCEPMK